MTPLLSRANATCSPLCGSITMAGAALLTVMVTGAERGEVPPLFAAVAVRVCWPAGT